MQILFSILIFIMITIFFYSIIRGKRKQQYPLTLVHHALYVYMRDLHDLCEEHNLAYWADGGTLLGAVRERGIIPHDDDIDLCMYENDLNKLIEIVNGENNEKHKYSKYHIYLLDHQPIYKFEHRDIPGIFIDIFVVDQDEKDQKKIVYKHPKNQKVWPSFYYYKDEVYPLRKITFGEIQIYTPNTPIPALERGYGKNWQTPIDYGRH